MNYLSDELLRIENDSRYSVADTRSGQNFKTTWEGRWKQQVTEQVRDRQADNSQKRDALYEQVRDVQRALDEDKRSADAGDLPHTDLMNRRRAHLNRMGDIERRFEGLQSSEALIAYMQADPVEWLSAFYEKWAPLRDRRPSIDAWIEDDRLNRGRR